MHMDVPNWLLMPAYLAMCMGWCWLTAQRERAMGFFRRGVILAASR